MYVLTRSICKEPPQNTLSYEIYMWNGLDYS